jgi:hypothetical protein
LKFLATSQYFVHKIFVEILWLLTRSKLFLEDFIGLLEEVKELDHDYELDCDHKVRSLILFYSFSDVSTFIMLSEFQLEHFAP